MNWIVSADLPTPGKGRAGRMAVLSHDARRENEELGLTTTAHNDQLVFPEKLSLHAWRQRPGRETREGEGRTRDMLEGKYGVKGLKRRGGWRVVEEQAVYNERRRWRC
jgi:hypothetical protein